MMDEETTKIVNRLKSIEGHVRGVEKMVEDGDYCIDIVNQINAIQAALHAYYSKFGEWPTASGEPGDIKWNKLVPDFLPYIPHTDSQCDWQVNSDPEGEVCLWEIC